MYRACLKVSRQIDLKIFVVEHTWKNIYLTPLKVMFQDFIDFVLHLLTHLNQSFDASIRNNEITSTTPVSHFVNILCKCLKFRILTLSRPRY